ncbi:FtsX-like permease family protein [Kitasatospora sp. NPDC002227]|uniref:FtsX-like permease family protein n=1 Tax=Kitasatospora sp. NPDC002227 TaxID=3154773 RepID=UPI0033315645
MSTPRRWADELALGTRLAFTGGRAALARTLLTAVGVGLGVAMLLLASSVPVLKHHRDDRIHALRDLLNASADAPRTPHSLLMTDLGTTYHGREVRGRAVQPDGPGAVLPPGLSHYPAPGELAVSPALAELLTSPDGRLLAERIGPHPVTARIAPAGLVGPGDYSFYLGSDRLAQDPAAVRLDHFGEQDPPKPLEPVLLLLSIVGVVILLTPVGVFVAAAARFGGEARDRRLAALRLVGADRAAIRRIAAGESLAGALLGLAVGGVFFLAGGQLLELVTVEGLSVFASDLTPQPALAALALAAVPLLAVTVTLAAMRRINAEPLAVTRAGAARRQRWFAVRLALPLLGGFLLYRNQADLADLGRASGLAPLIAGLLLLLLGTTALLPAVLGTTARLLGRAGPVSWQLAVRRIQWAPQAASRPIGGIVVAVSGAIALQALLGGIATDLTPLRPAATGAPVLSATSLAGGASAASYASRLRGTPGVLDATGYQEFYVQDGGTTSLAVRVSDCAGLRIFAKVPDCRDGDLFTSPDALARLGTRPALSALWPGGAMPAWRPPVPRGSADALAHPVLPTLLDRGPALYATWGALPPEVVRQQDARVLVHVDRRAPDAVEQIRTTMAGIDPHIHFYDPAAAFTDKTFLGIRRALTAGVAATLTLIAASMLVGLVAQLRERRRSLAVLAAFGTRRRTLGAALLWQVLLPVVLGLALAVGAGAGLASVLLRSAGLPVVLDWGQAGVMAAAGLGAVLALTALSLPVLRRATRAAGLRHE